MHLSIVLIFVLSIFTVQSHCFSTRNNNRPSYGSDEVDDDDDSSPDISCGCKDITKCPEENRDTRERCLGVTNVHCCLPVEYETPKPNQQSVTNSNSELAWPNQQGLSQIITQVTALNTLTFSQPITQHVHMEASQEQTFVTTSTHFQPAMQTKLPALIPTHNQNFQPKPQNPPQKSSLTPVTSTTHQPQLPSPSASSPSSNGKCVCTSFFRCFDEETSSNLTNLVNDRLNIPSNIPSCLESQSQSNCPNPNDVCCCNLEKPSEQPKQPSPSTPSHTACEGNCKPANDCLGKDIPSTDSKQGTCTDPDHICCQELVQPVSTQTSTLSPSSNPQPSNQSDISSSSDSDCTGTCAPISECPEHEDTWETALTGNSEAIQKLRKLSCSRKNNHVYVCCHN